MRSTQWTLTWTELEPDAIFHKVQGDYVQQINRQGEYSHQGQTTWGGSEVCPKITTSWLATNFQNETSIP